ncbi:MAG: hypothetical protein GT589_02370 [Peptoclostridium sp.]|uniref:hypothetical protein n=1 Tax=Peptoclostridium sp. TaxID=1904860 RepID=UPI00139C24B8|nr:hypothetical protein [Peptoclostridium sp.]MZQ74985.1 hypothetical protein [Peptoclostridium sp.]
MKVFARKTVLMVSLALLTLVLSVGCMNPEPEKPAGNQSEKNKKFIEASKELRDINELTLLDEYEIDLEGDGQMENVQMYTAAQKDPSGNIMWDDGQNWLLTVRGEDREYVLFEGYVQLGEIKYWAYTAGSDSKLHITTLQPGSASLQLMDFEYDSDKDGFEGTEIFNPENVNLMHSSVNVE